MMKKWIAIGFFALFGMVFTLNWGEASHFHPISVVVNKPVGEEVVMETPVQEPTQETKQESTGKFSEKPCTEPEVFGGVWESCGCYEPCWEGNCSYCVARRHWHGKHFRHCMTRCYCTRTITTGCGCGN